MRSFVLVGFIVLATVLSPLSHACKIWTPLINEIEKTDVIVVGYVEDNQENKYAVRTYDAGGPYDNEQRTYQQRWLHEATVVVTEILKGSIRYPRIAINAAGNRVQSIRVLHDGFIQGSDGRMSMISTDDHIDSNEEGIWLLNSGEIRGTYRRETMLPEGARDEVKRCLEVLQTGYRNWTPGWTPDASTWVTTWGCDMRIHVRAVSHEDGDITLSGVFRSELFDGGQSVLSSPEWDHFVARLDPSGKTRWTRALGCGQDFDPTPVAGHGGSVVLAGDFHQECSILGTSLLWTGSRAKLVVNISPDGRLVWSRAITGDVTSLSVLLDARGGYRLVGSYKGELACAGKRIVSDSESDWFIGELDPTDGTVRRLQSIPRGADESLPFARLGPKGEIVFAGYQSVDRAINGHSQRRSNVIVGSISRDGHLVWVDTLGGDWDDYPQDVAVAPDGMILATMTLTPSKLARLDPYDIVNAKLCAGQSYTALCAWSADGKRLWSATGAGNDVEVDADGKLYCAGSYRDDNAALSQLPSPAGGVDLFIECYDHEGNRLWAYRDGGLGAEYASSFTLLPGGRALIGGAFEGLSYLAGQTLRPRGYLDFFLANVALPKQ